MASSVACKFKKSLLKRLASSPNTCVVCTPANYHLSLHPYFLHDLSRGIREYLEDRITKYEPSLNGIVMGFDKIQLASRTGGLVSDHSPIHVEIKGDFYLFMPKVGQRLRGIVNRRSPTHVGVLVHKTFNVSLPKPIEEGKEKVQEEWVGTELQEGQEVQFEITLVDVTQTLPHIRGKITSVICKPPADHQDWQEFNEQDEIPCSQITRADLESHSARHDNEINSADLPLPEVKEKKRKKKREVLNEEKSKEVGETEVSKPEKRMRKEVAGESLNLNIVSEEIGQQSVYEKSKKKKKKKRQEERGAENSDGIGTEESGDGVDGNSTKVKNKKRDKNSRFDSMGEEGRGGNTPKLETDENEPAKKPHKMKKKEASRLYLDNGEKITDSDLSAEIIINKKERPQVTGLEVKSKGTKKSKTKPAPQTPNLTKEELENSDSDPEFPVPVTSTQLPTFQRICKVSGGEKHKPKAEPPRRKLSAMFIDLQDEATEPKRMKTDPELAITGKKKSEVDSKPDIPIHTRSPKEKDKKKKKKNMKKEEKTQEQLIWEKMAATMNQAEEKSAADVTLIPKASKPLVSPPKAKKVKEQSLKKKKLAGIDCKEQLLWEKMGAEMAHNTEKPTLGAGLLPVASSKPENPKVKLKSLNILKQVDKASKKSKAVNFTTFKTEAYDVPEEAKAPVKVKKSEKPTKKFKIDEVIALSAPKDTFHMTSSDSESSTSESFPKQTSLQKPAKQLKGASVPKPYFPVSKTTTLAATDSDTSMSDSQIKPAIHSGTWDKVKAAGVTKPAPEASVSNSDSDFLPDPQPKSVKFEKVSKKSKGGSVNEPSASATFTSKATMSDTSCSSEALPKLARAKKSGKKSKAFVTSDQVPPASEYEEVPVSKKRTKKKKKKKDADWERQQQLILESVKEVMSRMGKDLANADVSSIAGEVQQNLNKDGSKMSKRKKNSTFLAVKSGIKTPKHKHKNEDKGEGRKDKKGRKEKVKKDKRQRQGGKRKKI